MIKANQSAPPSLPEQLRRLGIDVSTPGFYDTPAFRRAEQVDASFLGKYADFVDRRPMSPEEVRHARAVVPSAARFLFERLARAQQLGACVNASMALSRFLERLGVWSYVVKGALTVSFAEGAGLPPVHIAPIRRKGSTPAGVFAGHAWVCAPPFRVVDVTAALQRPYSPAARAVLGDFFVAAESVQPASPEAIDLFDPECVAMFRRARGSDPTLRDVASQIPRLIEQVERYGAFAVDRGRARLKYVGYGMTAPSELLEDPTIPLLAGRSRVELYDELARSLAS